MADNDQDNDEYQFTELDSLDTGQTDEEQELSETSFQEQRPVQSGTNVKRNALIVIAGIVLAMGAYKIASWVYSEKPNNASQIMATPAPINPQPVQTSVIKPTPTVAPVLQPAPQPVAAAVDNDLKQKVSTIEQSQQSVRMEINSVGQQVGTVNNNVNNLNTQIANLNQVITNLTNQLARQSEEISILMARSQPKVVHKIHRKIPIQRIYYYIQAVIPGRAWLIGSNGSTLTVREGTHIAGYGVVRLIDSLQGRVLTSSGHIIKFSQDDS